MAINHECYTRLHLQEFNRDSKHIVLLFNKWDIKDRDINDEPYLNKWIMENGNINNKWRCHSCEIAAFTGDLKTLIWARTVGCRWKNKETQFAAMQGGHSHIINWLFNLITPY